MGVGEGVLQEARPEPAVGDDMTKWNCTTWYETEERWKLPEWSDHAKLWWRGVWQLHPLSEALEIVSPETLVSWDAAGIVVPVGARRIIVDTGNYYEYDVVVTWIFGSPDYMENWGKKTGVDTGWYSVP